MRIPSNKKIGYFAKEMLDACNASKSERIERGSVYRQMFLTGSDMGDPAAYNVTFAFIDNLSSYLYSPVELRFQLDAYGHSNPVDRAKMMSAGAEFHKQVRRSETDMIMGDAVTWGLVKGKSFIKKLWTNEGFKDILVQPEMMGVLEENLNSLDEQDAFVHTTYITPDRLYRILKNHPNRDHLMGEAKKYASLRKPEEQGDADNQARQIVIGQLHPYQIQGQGNSSARGAVRWLEAPRPNISSELVSSLLPLHELWIWDDERGDYGEYTTIQFVNENCVIFGETVHRNIFADQFDPDNRQKKTSPSEMNPLSKKHPFNEICPNPLDGYFWGRSELCNTSILQEYINARIIGINQMLRRQEDPPKFFSGTQGIKQQAYSMIKKAGGYFTDSNPNAKVQDIYPQLPEGLWESLHEFEAMFEKMGGFTPTMSGRGESGVRAMAHADKLTRNAAPRFKDRALLVERQIESCGSLALDMLRAHCPDPLLAWVPKKESGAEGGVVNGFEFEQPPAPGLVPLPFTFYELPGNCRVSVDSHSSSPAFADESKGLLFELFKTGAIDVETLLRHLHPAGADRMMEDQMRARFERQAQMEKLMQENPELAKKEMEKPKKK